MNKIIVSIFAALAFVFMAPNLYAASVTTAGVSNITQNSATVSGVYSLGSSSAEIYFEYADNSGFFGSKNTAHAVYVSSGSTSANLTGLTPNTRYYYRLMAEGAVYESGGTLNFMTLPNVIDSPVSAVTTGSKDITINSATITGIVSNIPSSVYFEYGKTTTLGSTIVATTNVSGNSTSAYANISNLEANTKYYYRVVASNSAGDSNGSIMYFTTLKNGSSAGSCAITSFYANTNSVYAGSPVALSWATTGCTYVNFGQTGGGSFPLSGSATVTLNNTATYKLYAYGTNNNDTRSITITVVNNGGGNNNDDCRYYNNCDTTCTYNCDRSRTSDCSWYNCWTNNFNPNNNLEQPCVWRGTCGAAYNDSRSYNARTANASYSVNSNSNNNGYSNPVVNSSNQNNNSSSSNNTKGVYDISKNSSVLLSNNSNTKDVSTIDSENINNNQNNLAAGAGWSIASFLPSTLVGWLLFIIFVLIIIFIARKLSAKKDNHSHGHSH